jgi:hypothetical protein
VTLSHLAGPLAWLNRTRDCPDRFGLPTGPEPEENPKVAKALRCRLRLHAWEDRENPETRDHYQVCIRCDAYRDKGQVAPGAGAAGVTGMGFG